MFSFDTFTRQLGDLRSQIEKITDAIADREAQIKFLQTSPPPKEDVLAACELVFAARAESAVMQIEKAIAEWHRRPLALADGSAIAAMRLVNAVNPGNAPTPFTLECSLFALIGEPLRAGVRKLIDGMDWPTPGPAIADRPALIAAAEKDLADLRRQLADMREKAADAGVIL